MSYVGTRSIPAIILINTALSNAVELNGADVIRFSMPAAWTAADITFQISDDGGTTFRDLYMEWGFELGMWVDVDMSIETSVFLQLRRIDQIKIRSGTSGAPVNQLGERIIILEVGAK